MTATIGRRFGRHAAAAAGSACLVAATAQAAAPPLQTAIEAAYLAKFAPFVSWPRAAFPDAATPLTLCVQGDDPFDGLLDRLTAGQSVGAHPLQVRRVARLDAASGCQIAFVAGSAQQSKAAALEAVKGQPVLTVADADDDPATSAIVRMALVKGRVRFAIDAQKASQSGLAISSKLLALAAQVTR